MIVTFKSPARAWGDQQAWGTDGFNHWFFACQLADLESEGPRQSAAFYLADGAPTDAAAAWAVGQLALTEANPRAVAELAASVAFFTQARS